MGLLDGLINRWFKTGISALAADPTNPEVLSPPRAAVRFVGATITDVPDLNRTDVEFPGAVTLSDATPAANSGAGAVGVATTAARGDHVHPAISSLDGTTVIVTSSNETRIDGETLVRVATSDANTLEVGHGSLPTTHAASTWALTATSYDIAASGAGVIEGGTGLTLATLAGDIDLDADEDLDLTAAAGAAILSLGTPTGGWLRAEGSGDSIWEHDSGGMIVQADGGLTVTPSGGGEGAILSESVLRRAPRGSDLAAQTLEVRGGDAWASATTNVVGAALRLRGGKGKTDGTNLHGGVDVSLGRLDSGNSSAMSRWCYATTGTDYFATEALRVQYVSGAYVHLRPATNFYLQNPAGYIALNAAAILNLEAGNGAWGGAIWDGTSARISTPFGILQINGPSGLHRLAILTPAKYTHTGAGAENIVSIAASASYGQIVEAHLHVEDPAAPDTDYARFKLTASLRRNGTAAWGDFDASPIDSGGAGTGWTVASAVSGANGRINVAAAAGVISTLTIAAITRS